MNLLFADDALSNSVIKEVSVTATRIARPVVTVPESIAVINKQRIANAKMQNIKETLTGVPGVLIDTKNGGYDARLVIRGAGQKAPYGVREITILRDGVPMTDPDSFSRLDFIDTQDIEQIEVSKGPGSLYGVGSAGGTVQIISKSVFDIDSNNLKLSMGNYGAQSYHLRYGDWINNTNAFAITASRRVIDNDWRRWNTFSTNQISLKHGVMLDVESSLETEISYSEADLQLPNSMSEAQFNEYKDSGEQKETQDAWKHSGRYSKILFFNSKYEKKVGDYTYKPRLYFTHWSHYHPVTGAINDSPENMVYGTDLELNNSHKIFNKPGSLVAGITLRQDVSNGAKKYQYSDVQTIPSGRITATLSDNKGELLEREDATNTLYGLFVQESIKPTDDVTVDIGMRADRSNFAIDTNETGSYSYSTGSYVTGDGYSSRDKSFTLLSPKIGVNYAVTPKFNLFATIAQSDQVPSSSEIKDNLNLKASTSTNYEVGVKGRGQKWNMDISLYYNPVDNEIVSSIDDDGATVYQNAGKTDKKGLELAVGYRLPIGFGVGATYSYSSYKFDSFQEVVRGVVADRSGNYMPFVPKNQGSIFLNYNHSGSGFKARLQSDFWGEYNIDNTNSETYEGYDFLTNLMLGYQKGAHSLMLNADNIFDKRYATEVKKSSSSAKKYYAGSPLSVMLTYSYTFSGNEFLPGASR
ncbi:MAG: TonB-dependent receptor [Magnetococcales bacterium]|nr:TonB-dependent receptor [Magnetococcales bacterium]